MAFMNWDDSLSVKVPSIDAEHQKLVALINDFYNDIYHKSPREKIRDTVQGLIDYTESHFLHEEKLMMEVAFEDYDQHKKEHDAFVAKVKEFHQRMEDGGFVVSIEITNFLKDWIKNHILGTDQKYMALFQEKGIQ